MAIRRNTGSRVFDLVNTILVSLAVIVCVIPFLYIIVNVQYVSVPRSQEVDKLNVLMASNEAPDLCFTYNVGVVSNYVAQGGLTQLDSTISQYGKSLSKYLGDDVLKYGKFNNKLYSIPGKRTMQMLHANWVRKDWLDKLGMKTPTTVQEFYNMLVAFRDKNPGSVSGGCTPFGVVIGYSSGQMSMGNLAESFLTDTSGGTIAKYTTDASSGLMWWGMPGFKDYMQFMNILYNENLISNDFAVDKTNSQRDADTANGKVGAYSNTWDYIYRSTPGIYTTLKKNVSSAELVPVDCFKNTHTGKYTKLEYAQKSAYMIVPKFSKHATQVVQYLNWLSDSKVPLAMQYGEEGIDYTLTDGVPKPTTPSTYTGQKFMGSVCNGDYDMLHNGPEVGSQEKNIQALSYSYPGYNSEVKQSAEFALKDTFNALAFTIPNSVYQEL